MTRLAKTEGSLQRLSGLLSSQALFAVQLAYCVNSSASKHYKRAPLTESTYLI